MLAIAKAEIHNGIANIAITLTSENIRGKKEQKILHMRQLNHRIEGELTQAHSELFLTPHEELKLLRLAEAKFTPLGAK